MCVAESNAVLTIYIQTLEFLNYFQFVKFDLSKYFDFVKEDWKNVSETNRNTIIKNVSETENHDEFIQV